MKKITTLILTLLLGVSSLFGCSQSTDQTELPEVEEIVSTFASDIIVDEENKTLSQRVNITVYPEDATYKDLNLSIKFSIPTPYIDGEDTEVEDYISAVFEDEDTILITLLQPYGSYARGRKPVVRVESKNGVSLEIPIIYKGLATDVNYTCESSYISRLNSRNNAWLLVQSLEPVDFKLNFTNIFNNVSTNLTCELKAYGTATYISHHIILGTENTFEGNLLGFAIPEVCFEYTLNTEEKLLSITPKFAIGKFNSYEYHTAFGATEYYTIESISDDAYFEIVITDANSGLSLSIPFFIDEGVSAIESDSTEVVF